MLSPNLYIYLRQSLPTVGELRCITYFNHRIDISVDTAIEMIDRLKTYSEEYLTSHSRGEQFTFFDVSKAIGFAYMRLDMELYSSL